MASRMDKYYKTEEETSVVKRSNRNEELYRQIYNTAEYTNIEGIARIEKTNEIDLEKIKEMLHKSEPPTREKREFQESKPQPESVSFDDEMKNYDIRDILNKAKEERLEVTTDYRKLSAEILEMPQPIVESKKDEEQEMQELISTMAAEQALSEINDAELSLGILDDLKSDTTTINQDANREALEKTLTKELQTGLIDKSFYTKSMDLTEEDFNEIEVVDKKLKKNNVLIKILIIILVLVILVAIGFVVKSYIL